MSAPLVCSHPIPETLVEIFSAIDQFTTSADFANWLTNGKFNYHIYENVVEEEKYKRTYQYNYEGHIFFQGKIEVDLSLFPSTVVHAFTSKSLVSIENPLF